MKFRQNLILLIVLIIFAGLIFLFEKPFEDKSKKIREEASPLFPGLETQKVKKILVKKGKDITTTLINRDNAWYIIGKEEYPADVKLVEEAIDRLKSLKKINLASRKKDKQALFEAKEGIGIEVILFGTEEKEITRLFIGKSGPDILSTYIRRADSDEVFLSEGYLKGDFDRQVNTWRDKTIFDFNPNEVLELKIVKQQETILLNKDNKGNWHIEEPISGLGEGKEVEKLLSTLAGLRAVDFADEDKELNESGLNNPGIQVSVKLKDGNKKTLLIGAKKGENQYYVKSEEKKYFYLLYTSTVASLTPAVKDLEKVKIAPEETKEKPTEKKELPPSSPPGKY